MQWLCSSALRRPDGGEEVRGQLADRVRRQQPARVLEVEPVHLRAVGERRGALGVVLVRVDRADRVREPDHDLLDPLGPRDRRQMAQTRGIVGRVGDLEAPDPVAGHEPEREAHHLLVGRHPGDEAHPGRDHPERRVRHRLADEPDPLPRVLAVEADRDRHVRARGEVERVVADPVERRRDRRARRASSARSRSTGSGCRREWSCRRTRSCRIALARSQSVVDRAGRGTRGGRARREQRPVGLDALDVELLERRRAGRRSPARDRRRGRSAWPAASRSTAGRSRPRSSACRPAAAAARGRRRSTAVPGLGMKPLGHVLGVQPALDRVPGRRDVVLGEAERLAVGDAAAGARPGRGR